MTSWPVRSLGEIASGGGEIRTGPFGSQLHQSDYTDSPDGVPVVMPLNMIGGRIKTDGIAKVTSEKAVEMAGHATRVGDVLLSRRGDIGRYCLVDAASAGALCGTGSLRVSIQESQLMPQYLCFFLETPSGLHELQGKAVGSTMPNINASIVRSLQLPVPPLPTQRKIAAILSAYDDLIANNNRRIKLLEDMAAAIFREWFVDYRYPGHIDSSMADVANPHLPAGWSVKPLVECCSYLSRGISPKYSDTGSGAVVNQKCVRNGRFSLAQSRKHESQVPEGKLLREGDVLVNSTGVGTLGRVGQVMFACHALTADSHVSIVRADRHIVTANFLGLTLLGREAEIELMGVGSTGQTELSRQRLGVLKLVVPPLDIQMTFDETVQPLRRLAVVVSDQTELLRTIRDLLLPRLISGEIDVEDLDIDTSGLAA